eukprot:10355352-Prorocentrum_lima.AAC.1
MSSLCFCSSHRGPSSSSGEVGPDSQTSVSMSSRASLVASRRVSLYCLLERKASEVPSPPSNSYPFT